jgi:MFS family permease
MTLYIFLAMNAFYMIAIIGTRPIVSLFANYHGATPMVIGLLVSTYAFFPMLFAITVGKWLDHFGARKVTLWGGGGIVIALLLPVLFPDIIALFFSQICLGFAHLCVLLALQKTVGNLPGNRDKLIAWFSLTASTGELIGPLISRYVYEHYGFQYTYVLSTVFVLIALLMGLFLKSSYWKSSSPTPSYIKQELRSTFRLLTQVNLRKAIIISGLVLYSKDLFTAYFPIYATGVGMSPSQIGGILSTMAGMSMVVRLSQFYLVNTFGRGKVLTVTLIMSGVSFLMVPLFALPIPLAGLALFLGAGMGLGQPLSLVYSLNQSPIERQGEVLGLRLTVNRASQFAAPFLFGTIGGVGGVTPIFWVSGGILLIGAYFTRMTSTSKNTPVSPGKTA